MYIHRVWRDSWSGPNRVIGWSGHLLPHWWYYCYDIHERNIKKEKWKELSADQVIFLSSTTARLPCLSEIIHRFDPQRTPWNYWIKAFSDQKNAWRDSLCSLFSFTIFLRGWIPFEYHLNVQQLRWTIQQQKLKKMLATSWP